MDLLKIEESLSFSKKTITQIYGLPGYGKSTLLSLYADFYLSLGKYVILVDYGCEIFGQTAHMLGLENFETHSDSIRILSNIDLDQLLETFKNKNFNQEKVVILINGLDLIPTNRFVGAPTKKKQYLISILNEFLKYSCKIIFTNNCFYTFNEEVVTTIKIPVHYSINLDSKIYPIMDELKRIFLCSKRKYKISNLDI